MQGTKTVIDHSPYDAATSTSYCMLVLLKYDVLVRYMQWDVHMYVRQLINTM